MSLGVMVAQQILVLLVRVRISEGHQKMQKNKECVLNDKLRTMDLIGS